MDLRNLKRKYSGQEIPQWEIDKLKEELGMSEKPALRKKAKAEVESDGDGN